jgi:TPR repeat protein
VIYRLIYFFLFLSIAACSDSTSHKKKEFQVPDLPGIQAKLTFACAHESDHIAARDPEADQLYKHARWLQKGNILKDDPSVYPAVERLMRIATAYKHDKANLELRELIAQGQAYSLTPVRESLNLTEELIQRGVPGGYYDMGRYLERGYGVRGDTEMALKYFRKSADLGSPEGQFLVGTKLLPIDRAPEVGKQMLMCAAQQGHGGAGVELGVRLQVDEDYAQALIAFQLGTKGGNATAASFLADGFKAKPHDTLNFISVERDDERSRRYSIVSQFLSSYDYLNATVPEIDEIIPLPPAKLPAWDGKLKWLKEHEANIPPPLPTEARIAEMARAKGLDPVTGRPLSWKDGQ